MNAAKKTKRSAPKEEGYLKVALFAAALVIGAGLLSLSGVLTPSGPGVMLSSDSTDQMPTNLLTPAEIASQHAAYQPPKRAKAASSIQPAGLPTNRSAEEIKLQKAKANVHQQIADRLKQYVKEHPELDTRKIEKEIEKREKMAAQGQ